MIWGSGKLNHLPSVLALGSRIRKEQVRAIEKGQSCPSMLRHGLIYDFNEMNLLGTSERWKKKDARGAWNYQIEMTGRNYGCGL